MNHGAQEEYFPMLKPFSHEEFSEPILHLKVDVTASCLELRRDGRIPISGRQEQRCGPERVLEVDEGLHASNQMLYITRGLAKLQPSKASFRWGSSVLTFAASPSSAALEAAGGRPDGARPDGGRCDF